MADDVLQPGSYTADLSGSWVTSVKPSKALQVTKPVSRQWRGWPRFQRVRKYSSARRQTAKWYVEVEGGSQVGSRW